MTNGVMKLKVLNLTHLLQLKRMVSFWADEYTLNGDKMNGQNLVRWKKEGLCKSSRIR